MANKKPWIVTIGGDRSIQDIAGELAKAGHTDIRVLDEVGCITGSAEDEAVSRLRRVRGVMDISPDVPVHIGPPDLSDTW